MVNEFSEYGSALVANGFPIVPITPGRKSPAIKAWQENYITDQDIFEVIESRHTDHGVGVTTGVGEHPVIAIDIDTSNKALAEEFSDWCEAHFGMTVSRVGNAPKTLLVYRSDDIKHKVTGASFGAAGEPIQRVEILSKGQQFVAYATHPDTNRPYVWTDLLGGLSEVSAEDLPCITQLDALKAVEYFETLAEKHGLSLRTRPATPSTTNIIDDPWAGLADPLDKTVEEIKDIIQWHDPETYDTWLQVGMALHHECRGSTEGLELWDEWSQNGGDYQGFEDLGNRWDGFGQKSSGPSVTLRSLIAFANKEKKKAERDEHREVRDQLKSLIANCDDPVDLMGPVAIEIGSNVNNNPALRAEMFGLLKDQFKALTGQPIPLAAVKKSAKGNADMGIPVSGPKRRERTEFGNAERMLDTYGKGLMYVPELGLWHKWNDNYWVPCNGVELEHLAKETVRALGTEIDDIESDDDRESFYKFCAMSQRAQMVRNMVGLAASDPRVAVPFRQLNRDHFQLGVANGIVDLRTGTLSKADPKARITVATKAKYRPEAKAPLFEQTVSDVFFNDVGMVKFFQRLMGYTLLGDPKEDILVIPYGSGSNGKSTVLGAIREALGGHSKAACAETFLSDRKSGASAGGPREDILRLRGSRFVYVSEPDEGSELREGMIKSMTGGDPMPARGIHGKSTVEVVPTWCAIMPTNHKPIVKGDDHAIWRRLLPVPFIRNFDKDENVVKDTERGAKLRAEADGILTWCVEGALAYQREGLNLPDAVQAARDSYRNDMDLLRDWLEDCCEEGDGLFESTQLLWASWERFSREQGEVAYIRSSRALGRRLSTRFPPTKQGGKRGYAGLCVKPDADFDHLG